MHLAYIIIALEMPLLYIRNNYYLVHCLRDREKRNASGICIYLITIIIIIIIFNKEAPLTNGGFHGGP